MPPHESRLSQATGVQACNRRSGRIASRFGHLANDVAARLLAGLDCSRLQHLIAAHLSQQNNTPELARGAMAAALGCAPEWIGIATQDDGFAWRAVS